MNNEMYQPDSYKEASNEKKKKICNGCGPGGWKFDLVPDTMYGLSITEACNVHDWMYYEGDTTDDKKRADRILLENILLLIDNNYSKSNSWWKGLIRWLRRRRAYKYYEAVADFGGSSYESGEKDNGTL